jgi:hypothetical protein
VDRAIRKLVQAIKDGVSALSIKDEAVNVRIAASDFRA